MIIGVHVLACTEDDLASTSFRNILDDVKIHNVRNGEFPSSPSKVIISGSRSSVLDKEPWVREMEKMVLHYLRDDVDMLGVCFGHQLIADILGGKVERMDGYELGYTDVVLSNHMIYDGLNIIETPFVSHQDKVSQLPKNTEPIAQSSRCNHGFAHTERNVFGIQFHPEFDTKAVKKLIKEKDIDNRRTKQLLNSVTGTAQFNSRRTRKVFDNFMAL